jgi:hypothetical protein
MTTKGLKAAKTEGALQKFPTLFFDMKRCVSIINLSLAIYKENVK